MLVMAAAPTAKGAVRLDVFFGFDDTVHEAGWFPVAFEVFNDGPTFNGIIELSNESAGHNQSRQITLELPTGTLKREVIPVFASAGRHGIWSARLLDPRGRVRAERLNLQPKDKTWDNFLLGAVPRSFGGLPALPEHRLLWPDRRLRVAADRPSHSRADHQARVQRADQAVRGLAKHAHPLAIRLGENEPGTHEPRGADARAAARATPLRLLS